MLDDVRATAYPKIAKEHLNQWVVFSNETKEVLASGKTLKEALRAAPQRKDTGVMLVPESLPYSPIVH